MLNEAITLATTIEALEKAMVMVATELETSCPEMNKEQRVTFARQYVITMYKTKVEMIIDKKITFNK